MRALVLIGLLSIAGNLLPAQQHLKKPTRTAPSAFDRFSTVELQNADVSVRRLNIPAAESASISAGVHDYLIVSYGKSSLVVSGYQTRFDLDLADGDMQVMQGGWPHKLENHSTEAAHLVLVEVARNLFPKSAACGLAAKNCGEVRFGKSAQGEYQQTTLFETDTAKLFRVQIGAEVAIHQHADGRPHLLIALSPLQGYADGETFTLAAGDTSWHPGSMEELVNTGSSDARLLILELKRKY